MSKKVASLEKISKTYGKDDLTVKALDSINLEIYKGDYLAVMGASGSGKSTAMNIIGQPKFLKLLMIQLNVIRRQNM